MRGEVVAQHKVVRTMELMVPLTREDAAER